MLIESNFPSHLQTRETADLFLALILRLLKPRGRAAVVLPDGSLFGEGVKTRLKEQLINEELELRRLRGFASGDEPSVHMVHSASRN